MDDELCVRCGNRAPGFAAINGDRLCHGHVADRPTCYEAATAALAEGTDHWWDPAVEDQDRDRADAWERLKAHWAEVQAETRVEVERLRRQHPDIYSFGLPSAHHLATMQKLREER